jgi:hypothetical protein
MASLEGHPRVSKVSSAKLALSGPCFHAQIDVLLQKKVMVAIWTGDIWASQTSNCRHVCLCVQPSPPDSCLPKWPVAQHRLGEPDTVLEGCEGDLKCSSATAHHAKTVNVVGNKMQNRIFPV